MNANKNNLNKPCHEDCLELIKKYCKKNLKQWGREVKIAQRLLTYYPRLDFWANFDLDFKLNSLAYFLTPIGKQKLYETYKQYTFVMYEPPKYNIESETPKEENLLKDSVESTNKKPNSIIEFLR